MSRMRGDERGYATVCILAAGLVVVSLGLLGGAVGEATIARHRAQNIADLAALAGASITPVDPGGACADAASIAEANGGMVLDCHVDVFDVTVTVAVSRVSRLIGPATATARAGPVTAPPGAGPQV